MGDLLFILAEYIKEFLASPERELMLRGEKYYKYENDILSSDEDVKLVHGFMTNLVDEKVQYLLGKPFSISCEDEAYITRVKDVIGKGFQYDINSMGVETSNKGIGWWYIYINPKGEFKYLLIPSEQCVPIWTDNSQTELEAMLRVYDMEVYQGTEKKIVTKVEYYTPINVSYYIYQNGKLMVDAEMYVDMDDNQEYGHFRKGNEWSSWGKVPFVPFRNNRYELPDLKSVKTLIDEYDKRRSDISDILDECKNYIYVIRNYSGTDKGQFIDDLDKYRTILVDDNGGVDALTPKIDNEAAKQHFEQLKKDIQHFGQGVNKDSDAIGNSPSGIALKFLYSGLDLKCNKLEVEFKKAFIDFMYFVNTYMGLKSETVTDKDIDIVFSRDIAVNETDSITQCRDSLGVISNKTIISNHPWVTDVEEELKQIESENTIEDEYQGLNDKSGADE